MTGNPVERLRQSAGSLAAAQRAHAENAAGQVRADRDLAEALRQSLSAPEGGGDGAARQG